MIRQLDWQIGTEWDCVDVTFKLDTFKERKEMIQWCMDYEGKGGYFYQNDLASYNLFYFEREEDRMMFMLRWC